MSLTDHNYVKVVTMITPGKRENVDISRDFYTTIINMYNLKDATEGDWKRYKTVLGNTTSLKLPNNLSLLQRMNIHKTIYENALAEV